MKSSLSWLGKEQCQLEFFPEWLIRKVYRDVVWAANCLWSCDVSQWKMSTKKQTFYCPTLFYNKHFYFDIQHFYWMRLHTTIYLTMSTPGWCSLGHAREYILLKKMQEIIKSTLLIGLGSSLIQFWMEITGYGHRSQVWVLYESILSVSVADYWWEEMREKMGGRVRDADGGGEPWDSRLISEGDG